MIGFRNSLLRLVAGVAGAIALASAGVSQTKNPLLPGTDVGTASAGTKVSGQVLNGFEKNFLENKGQWNAEALFLSRTPGLNYWVTRTGAVLDFYTNDITVGLQDARRIGHVVRMDIEGATSSPAVAAVGRASAKVDFVRMGGKSVKGAGAFGESFVRNMLSGVDMRHYLDAGRPRYDLILKPGAKPANVNLRFTGSSGVETLPNGNLAIYTNVGVKTMAELLVYQTVNGRQQKIDARFVKRGANRVGFEIGRYNEELPLIIDPVVYGTYMGGDADLDTTTAVTSNDSGQVYITGETLSTDFPITTGPYGVNFKDSQDGYLVALSGDAYSVVYVAYVGGPGSDSPRFLQVDQYGSVWMAGVTTSFFSARDLRQGISPRTPPNNPIAGTFRLSYQGQDAFLAFDSDAPTVQTALNGFANRPASDFTVTGGPLPGAALTVTATGRDVSSLLLSQQVWPYSVDPATGTIDWVPPDAGLLQFGYRPTGGTFTLTVRTPGGTLATTGAIPFDADGARVRQAIVAAPVSIPAGDVAGAGGPLDGAPVTITFSGASAAATLVSINGGGLTDGAYDLTNATPRAYAVRFALSGTDVLDPITDELLPTLGGLNNPNHTLVGFAIRKVATPTGPVELYFAGTTNGALPEVAGTAAPGYLARMSYNHQTKVLTTQPTRGRYIGESLAVSVNGMAVDLAGSVYLTGNVTVPTVGNQNFVTGPTSTQFVTTTGVYTNGNLIRGNDAFIRKYDSNGALVYSASLGGSAVDNAAAVAVDSSGNAYVTGVTSSFNFPRTTGAFGQIFPGVGIVYVTKINASASQILYSTNLRTTGRITPNSIAVDSRGNAYVGGQAGFTVILPNQPTVPGAIVVTPTVPAVPGQQPADDPTYENGNLVWPGTNLPPYSTTDGFVTVLNSTATGLLYSSYIGGPMFEQLAPLYVDSTNSLYVPGTTSILGLQNPSVGYNGANTLPSPLITPLAFKAVPDFFVDGFLVKMRISLPTLRSVVMVPNQVAGGRGATSTGVVTLVNPAPVGGALVTIRVMNPTVARLTAGGATSIRITIPEGQTQGTFTAFSRQVTTPNFTDVRAELDGDFVVDRLNVRPWLDGFVLSTDELPGGNDVQATITLFEPAKVGGVDVTLSTDQPGLINFTSTTVNVPEGQQSITVTIGTNGVLAPTNLNLTASVDGVGLSQPLRLLPPGVLGISFNPTTVNGGESAIGTITLDGKAAAGLVIDLAVSGLPGATVPATVSVPANATSANFTITTPAVAAADAQATVTATIGAVSVQGVLLVAANDIQEITLTQYNVLGGAVVTGTVTLVRPAAPSGFLVQISNSNTAAGRFSTGALTALLVTVPAGQRTVTFDYQTFGVSTTQLTNLTVSKTGYTNRARTLTVRGVDYSVSVVPNPVVGGADATGTVTLLNGEVAPAGGLTLNLSSTAPALASVPSTVVVPAGQTSATFLVTTTATNVDATATIRAQSANGPIRSTVLNVLAPSLIGFTIVPNVVAGGQTPGPEAVVTLSSPAPAGGVQVVLNSGNTSAVPLAANTILTVPAGQTTARLTLPTNPQSSAVVVTMSATRGAITRTATLTINVPAVLSITFNPASVRGGLPSVGTVTLAAPAPAGGYTISLTSNNGSFVSFPATVVVPAGATSVNFNVTTFQVTREIAVLFTANLQGNTQTGTLFLQRNTN